MWAPHHEFFLFLQSRIFFSMYQRMISKETSWAGPRPMAHGFTIGQIVTFLNHGFVMLTVRMVIYGTLIVAISPMLGSVVPGTVPYPGFFAAADSCTGVQGTRGSSGIHILCGVFRDKHHITVSTQLGWHIWFIFLWIYLWKIFSDGLTIPPSGKIDYCAPFGGVTCMWDHCQDPQLCSYLFLLLPGVGWDIMGYESDTLPY